ncbi:MAG: FecCD family ABC transporter permease [Saccharofermentanales bacterium]
MKKIRQDFRSKEAELRFPAQRTNRRLAVLGVLFAAVFLASFSIGRFAVPPLQVIRILFDRIIPLPQTWTPQMEIVVINVRFPRIIAAALVGSALSVAGSIYQGIFRNPMVSPDILGSSAGSGFGAALGILMAFGYAGSSASAFFFGLIAMGLAVAAASRYRSNPTLGLILAGIMIGSLFSAGTSFIKLVADPTDQLPAITYWLMGSFSAIHTKDIAFLLPVMVIGILPLFLLRWRLNVLTLGEEESRSLGVDTAKFRLAVILCATLITSASVAVSGIVGWVGLVIPHIARKTVGCDFKNLLPASMLTGAMFLIIVDDLARTLATVEIPLSILTAFVGAPFFLHVILREGRRSV